MKSAFHKKTSFNQNNLLIDHIIDFKYHSDIPSLIKHKNDENEQKLLDFISDKNKFKIKPYFNQKEAVDFLSSKLRAMEKMNLDDECTEGKIETKKIIINKKIFPKSKHNNDKKGSTSPKKRKNKKSHPRKNPKDKTNKNIIINDNYKIERSNKNKKIDFDDDVVDDINEKIKQNELKNFFSGKSTLISIINEINGK